MLPSTGLQWDKVETDGLISKKMVRRIDDCLKCTLVAGKSALADAGLKWDGPELKDLDKQRCGEDSRNETF